MVVQRSDGTVIQIGTTVSSQIEMSGLKCLRVRATPRSMPSHWVRGRSSAVISSSFKRGRPVEVRAMRLRPQSEEVEPSDQDPESDAERVFRCPLGKFVAETKASKIAAMKIIAAAP